jgi:hypothetical protein
MKKVRIKATSGLYGNLERLGPKGRCRSRTFSCGTISLEELILMKEDDCNIIRER